ncbi:hypothetical protein EV44_g4357 [Erysiphe necator]|uniref:Uncharacterized protein n=1 Tax=Uncinula necator TaxID=52586 RepID=A0A0B1P9E9_UNCNE|nr:hypothetical protein EV44_g4357 [Erysiphe necator]
METTSLNEDNLSMETSSDIEEQIETIVEDFPPLPSAHSFTPAGHNADTSKSILMAKARGLLNLVGPYPEEMESSCPGAGVDFLALISEGVSRAIRGEKIYEKQSPNSLVQFSSQNKGSTWTTRAASGNRYTPDNIPRGPPSIPSPPQGQSKEDRRIMIRLSPEHESRKTDPLILRQQLQRLIPDPSLVIDAWQVPSGIAVLAPTPAKAAEIVRHLGSIEKLRR